jgi:hypothetical protein
MVPLAVGVEPGGVAAVPPVDDSLPLLEHARTAVASSATATGTAKSRRRAGVIVRS